MGRFAVYESDGVTVANAGLALGWEYEIDAEESAALDVMFRAQCGEESQ
jgi:hypothetical protein